MKHISIICALIMAAAALTACSNDSSSSKADETTSVTAVEETTKETETTAAQTKAESSHLTLQTPQISFAEPPTYVPPEITYATLASLKIEPFDLPHNDYGAEVDDNTGSVTLDSSVMFASNSSAISDDGKNVLKKFLDDYCEQMLSKNKDSIKRIKVEGHTDTEGTHEYNQKLSEDRANAVLEYSVSQHPELKPYLYAVGRSFDDPVYNSDGTVNMAKSRRVVFVPET